MSEQPAGYLEIDASVSSDELEQIQHEFEVMMRDYAGSTLPFPEYVAEYAKLHQRIWRWHPLPEQKHDGRLDTRAWGDGSHAECHIEPPGFVLELEDIVGKTMLHCYLEAKSALSLLDYLTQEKPTLERLAKEQGQ